MALRRKCGKRVEILCRDKEHRDWYLQGTVWATFAQKKKGGKAKQVTKGKKHSVTTA